MDEFGLKSKNADLSKLGLGNVSSVTWNANPATLIEDSIFMGEGTLADNGAIAVDTGEFTGRSPKDRFIVCDEITENTVWWGDVNMKFSPEKFDALYNRVTAYLGNRDIYARDSYVCADENYRLNVRTISELPWANLFAYNMFQRPEKDEIENYETDWNIVCAPGFMADPEIDGTRQHNFAIINFTRKILLIGGTRYTGEIKKGIFSVLNFILPNNHKVLSMHCSANIGKKGDTAVFFGLSGTGKTTLSSTPDRQLIGDDEHGWSDDTVFNIEGGCYAKCINLSKEKEPQIYNAIRFGSILENINFIEGSSEVDYKDKSKTENTRVSYPVNYIDNAVHPSIGGIPKNIFFLTCDAYGVLPPISKLSKGQAMYHFISGYTAKVAGTEAGVNEPQATFSACFGLPFMPLHPTKYAEMLGEKIDKHNVNVWLVNTGWSGGEYGVGERVDLAYTRAMVEGILNGKLEGIDYKTHPIFGLKMAQSCPRVPSEILDPRNTWDDKDAYDIKAQELAEKFNENFEPYAKYANEQTKAAAPKVASMHNY